MLAQQIEHTNVHFSIFMINEKIYKVWIVGTSEAKNILFNDLKTTFYRFVVAKEETKLQLSVFYNKWKSYKVR